MKKMFNSKMTIGNRIKKIRTAKGVDVEALRKKSGLAKSTIYDLERGDSKSTTKLHLIAAALNVRTEYLETGKGPIEPPVAISSYETKPGYVRLPLYEGSIAAGDSGYMPDFPEVVQYLDVAEWWASHYINVPIDRVRVLTARGNSMTPHIKNGDLLFVDSQITHFAGDGFYIINYHGTPKVKKLQLLLNGSLRIASSNPEFETEIVPKNELDTVHIGGMLLKAWTLQDF